ncbi:MAG: TetR/AcrR family transcriptional regulator; helix-turn-helix transcriptional regulator [Spirochaetaceae bacterium]|nr:TetR/AcrR family transcriptional regulator; helix-turn-helix transcriptional regulator [Spirochaetaceae bacterium]
MKSIADVVSIEGPWKTSMKMIAEKLGLSKSSLYFHFENKLDMMRRLFCIMSEDIIKRTQYVITFSSVPEEQLYFAIMGIVSYLKLKPEILVLLDWIRIRSTEFDVQPEEAVSSKCKEELLNIKRIHTMFSEIRNADNEALIDDTKTDCILFLIINLLMRRPAGMSFAEISNDSFRLLYKFIALGIENNI